MDHLSWRRWSIFVVVCAVMTLQLVTAVPTRSKKVSSSSAVGHNEATTFEFCSRLRVADDFPKLYKQHPEQQHLLRRWRRGADRGSSNTGSPTTRRLSGPDGGGACCAGREDRCAMRYEDTMCYCDAFCERRDASDCCPDYQSYCVGRDVIASGSTTNRNGDVDGHSNSTPDQLEPDASNEIGAEQIGAETLEILNKCLHENLVYNAGEVLQIDCNECICSATNNLTQPFQLVCTERQCAVSQQTIKDINSLNAGWTATSYVEFDQKTVDELLRERLGSRFPVDYETPSTNSADNFILSQSSVDDELPEAFDSRDTWPGMISQPLDQGRCGVSWAFSTAGVASDRLAIQTRGVIKVHLSAQHLVSCVGAHHNEHTGGCAPIGVDRAWWFLRKNGLVSDECYQYSSSGGPSHGGRCLVPRTHAQLLMATCPSSANNEPVNEIYRATPSYKIKPEERAMMAEIIENGPVQSMMVVRDDFFVYKSGVYRSTMSDSVDLNDSENVRKRTHSVRIIGWGTDYSTGTPLKYWLCANSWGPNWGEDGGYFRIARGSNESGIETLVAGAWMKTRGIQVRHQQGPNGGGGGVSSKQRRHIRGNQFKLDESSNRRFVWPTRRQATTGR